MGTFFGDNTGRNKLTTKVRAFAGARYLALYDDDTDQWVELGPETIETPFEGDPVAASPTDVFTAEYDWQGDAMVPTKVFAYNLDMGGLARSKDVYTLKWRKDLSFNARVSVNVKVVHGFYRDYLYVFSNVDDNAYIIDCSDGSTVRMFTNFSAKDFIFTDDYIVFGKTYGDFSGKLLFMTHEGEKLFEAKLDKGIVGLCEYEGRIYAGLSDGTIIIGKFKNEEFKETKRINTGFKFSKIAIDDKYLYLLGPYSFTRMYKRGITRDYVGLPSHAVTDYYTILNDHSVVITGLRTDERDPHYKINTFLVYNEDGSSSEVGVDQGWGLIFAGVEFSDWKDRIYYRVVYTVV